SSSVSCCAATAEASFAYACGAGGGTRRQSISTFSMLKCSNYMEDTRDETYTDLPCAGNLHLGV
ncbi:MAG: hypothetical protein LBM00_12090, partial [Deltaproteobacteria bacterium]|nr:hypothetical protein [Deltaproteobacteria bacterium]